jgi:hypothetical protein
MGKVYEKVVLSRITKTKSFDLQLRKKFMHSLSVYKAGIEPCSGTNPNCRVSGKVIPILFNILVIWLFVCFLDNQKAFDKIWHDGLFLKLKDLGVTDKLWNILFMSYKQASAHVLFRTPFP